MTLLFPDWASPPGSSIHGISSFHPLRGWLLYRSDPSARYYLSGDFITAIIRFAGGGRFKVALYTRRLKACFQGRYLFSGVICLSFTPFLWWMDNNWSIVRVVNYAILWISSYEKRASDVRRLPRCLFLKSRGGSRNPVVKISTQSWV